VDGRAADRAGWGADGGPDAAGPDRGRLGGVRGGCG